MHIKILLLILSLISTILCSCPLQRIPDQIYQSNRINSSYQIDDYIDTQYPKQSTQLTNSLKILQSYKNINSSNIIIGSPFPNYIVTYQHININNTLLFQLHNTITQQIYNKQNNKCQLKLNFTSQCKSIISNINLINININNIKYNIFTICQNNTYRISYLTNCTSYGDSDVSYGKLVNKNNYSSYYFNQIQRTQVSPISVSVQVVFNYGNNQSVIQVYGNQNAQVLQIIDKNSKFIKNVNISKFYLLDYTYGFGMRIFLLNQYGIALYDGNQTVDQIKIKDDKLLKIGVMCGSFDTNITVAFGENYIYVFQVSLPNFSVYYVGYYKEIAKFQRKDKGNNNTQFYVIGKYIIQKNGAKWRATYLSPQLKIKQFQFAFDTQKQKILPQKSLCYSNTFFIKNSKYLIQPPKILTTNSRTITLNSLSSNCNKTVQIIKLNQSAIQQINKDKNITYIDGNFYIQNKIFIGDNINSRIQWNGAIYQIPNYLKYQMGNNLQTNTTILNYIQISQNGYGILVQKKNTLTSYLCYQNNCWGRQIRQQCEYYGSHLKLVTRNKVKNSQFIGQKVLLFVISTSNGIVFTFFNIYKNNRYATGQIYGPLGAKYIMLQPFQILSYTDNFQVTQTTYQLKQFQLKLITKSMTNSTSFSHFRLYYNAQYQSRSYVGQSFLNDLPLTYSLICNLQQQNNKIMLIKYQSDGNLTITSVASKRINQYYFIVHSNSYKQFKGSQTFCLQNGIGILTSNNSIYKINYNLQQISIIKLNQNVLQDLINNKLIVHKLNKTHTQIYNINNGILLTTLAIPIQNMKLDKNSQSILVNINNNITLYNFAFNSLTYQNITYKGDDRAYLYGSNGKSTVSRLKNVIIKQTLKMPNSTIIQIQSDDVIDNFWNCTINQIKGNNIIKLSHFQVKQKPTKFQNDKIATRIYKIHNKNFHFDFNLESLSYSYIYLKYNDWSDQTDERGKLWGMVNFAQGYYSIWGNSSYIAMIKTTLNISYYTKIDQRIYCPISAYTPTDNFFQQKLLTDNQRLYLLKYTIKKWNDSFIPFIATNQYKQTYSNNLTRTQISLPKLQIYTYSSQCKLEQIDGNNYNLNGNQQIIDYTLIVRNNISYIVLLFDSVIVFQRYPLTLQQYLIYKHNSSYIKIQTNANSIFLISKNSQHIQLNINWSIFPNSNSITLKQRFIQSIQVKNMQIIDGKYINNMLLTCSQYYIYLYHLTNNSDVSYSAERISNKNITNGIYDLNQYLIKRLVVVSDTQITVQLFYTTAYDFESGKRPQAMGLVSVSRTLGLGDFDKVTVNNTQYTKQYKLQKNNGYQLDVDIETVSKFKLRRS